MLYLFDAPKCKSSQEGSGKQSERQDGHEGSNKDNLQIITINLLVHSALGAGAEFSVLKVSAALKHQDSAEPADSNIELPAVASDTLD